MTPLTFGGVVRALRDDAHLTGAAAAAKAEVSKGFWSDVENDRRTPGDDAAERMRRALNADVGAWAIALARARLGNELFETVALAILARSER